MQYTSIQVLKYMLSNNDIAFDYIAGYKWTYFCFTKASFYPVCIGYILNGTFKIVALPKPMPNTLEEQCKMFLDECFKLAQKHDLIIIESSFNAPTLTDHIFIKQGSTIEQVLIDMDMHLA